MEIVPEGMKRIGNSPWIGEYSHLNLFCFRLFKAKLTMYFGTYNTYYRGKKDNSSTESGSEEGKYSRRVSVVLFEGKLIS